MGQILHGSARTTEAVRRAIQHSQESLRALSKRYGINQMTTLKGRRSSSASAFLAPAKRRSNLHVVTEALVTKIDVDAHEATAVRYERGGTNHRATARREIVLAAGSFATPQLLQLSGIGPGSLLSGLGIPVAHELRGVGENLIDHITNKRSYTTSSRHTFNATMSNIVSQGLAGLRYMTTRSGPLAVGAALAGGFAHTRPGLEEPDIQLFSCPLKRAVIPANCSRTQAFSWPSTKIDPKAVGPFRSRQATHASRLASLPITLGLKPTCAPPSMGSALLERSERLLRYARLTPKKSNPIWSRNQMQH